jgi:hypothetical protein
MRRTDLIDSMFGIVVAHSMAEIAMYGFFAHGGVDRRRSGN